MGWKFLNALHTVKILMLETPEFFISMVVVGELPCTLLHPYPLPLVKRRRIVPVKAKHKHVLSGCWGVLWKENYIMWITLEPLLSACPWHVWSLINFKWVKRGHPHHIWNKYDLFFLYFIKFDNNPRWQLHIQS